MTENIKIPSSVALVGNGPSRQDFITDIASFRGDVPWEQVWVLNFGIMTYRHDLAFVIDDNEELARRFPKMGNALRSSEVPIMTSTPYPEFPRAVAYPYDEVLDRIGIPNVLCNSGPMALAYCLIRGVKKIFMYGFDYTYPSMKVSEFGGQAVAFLIGLAGRFGASVELTPSTTMLGNIHAKFRKTDKGLEMDFPYYGFKHNMPLYDGLAASTGDK